MEGISLVVDPILSQPWQYRCYYHYLWLAPDQSYLSCCVSGSFLEVHSFLLDVVLHSFVPCLLISSVWCVQGVVVRPPPPQKLVSQLSFLKVKALCAFRP